MTVSTLLKTTNCSPCTDEALVIRLLEIGAVCGTFSQFLSFGDLRSVSSLCHQVTSRSDVRIHFFARAKLNLPLRMNEVALRAFVRAIRTDALPFIKALGLRSHTRVERINDVEFRFHSSTPPRSAWAIIPNIEALDLTGSFAAKLEPLIGNYHLLKTLDLSSVIAFDLTPLARLHTLEHLFLNFGVFTNNELAHLRHLRSLKTLEMPGCRFVDDLSPLVVGLTQLRRLVLGDGDMALRTFVGFDAFTELRHFHHVGQSQHGPHLGLPLRAPYLEHCVVSKTQLRDTAFLRFSLALVYLDISGTGLTTGVPFGSLKVLEVLVTSSPLPPNEDHFAPLASLSKISRIEFRTWGAALDSETVCAVFPERVRPLLVIAE